MRSHSTLQLCGKMAGAWSVVEWSVFDEITASAPSAAIQLDVPMHANYTVRVVE